MKKSVILLLLLSCFQYALSQGLQFHGNENDIDERLSLAIPAELSDARSVETISWNSLSVTTTSPARATYSVSTTDMTPMRSC